MGDRRRSGIVIAFDRIPHYIVVTGCEWRMNMVSRDRADGFTTEREDHDNGTHMKSETVIPKFESEAEEAQWWFDHREDTAKLMQDAVAKGETTNLAAILRKRRDGGVDPNRPG
jgi:hypothetical protein